MAFFEYSSCKHIETKECDVQEQACEIVTEEPQTEKDIYEAQGYAAIPMEDEEMEDEEEGGYFENGYMTLPDEDPDEDKRTFIYPENYAEIAGKNKIIMFNIIL